MKRCLDFPTMEENMVPRMLFSDWLRGRAQRFFSKSLLAIIALSGTSCSVIVDSGRQQCSTTADCQKRGGVFAKALCSNSVCVTDPKWGCVGSVVWPMVPPVASPEKVTAKISLSNLLTGDVIAGAKARVCGKLDPACDLPLQTDVVSDAEGVLTLQLNKFFEGYLEIKFPEMVDTMYYFNPPLDSDRVIPFIPLVPFSAFTVFGEQLKMKPLLDRGTVIGLTYDCQGTSAEGIELSTDGADEFTTSFYMVQGSPRIDATQTDKSGQGGVANVPVGARLISGRRSENGEVIGIVSVQTRALWITYTSMLPTPLSSQK
jgi:hypothetical protein